MNLDLIAQIGLSIFGIAAIFLVGRKNKWGFVMGVLAQPFWLTTSYINQQWGVFFVSIIYTISWIYGIHEWFFKNKKKTKR